MRTLAARALVLVAFVFATASCSSIRMKYDANVVADDGRSGKVEFEKSYDVGSFPVLCAVTGIFFGGACWYYVVMPTTYQQEAVAKDARAKLDEQLGQTPYELKSATTVSTGWKDEAERFEFKPASAAAPGKAAAGQSALCSDIAGIEKLIADEKEEEQPDAKLIAKLEKRLAARRKYLSPGQKCE